VSGLLVAADPVALVVAKMPVPGHVKTRLAATVGDRQAAVLAEAALLDTVQACAEAFGARRCHLAFAGPHPATGSALARALERWTLVPQTGHGLAARIANAHRDVHSLAYAPVVQVGMDTPQVDARELVALASLLTRQRLPVLGPAADGGWWLLGSTCRHDVAGLERVPMSTADTGAATLTTLRANRAPVRIGPVLRDVDDAADAEAVALAAPRSRFARAWRAHTSTSPVVGPR